MVCFTYNSVLFHSLVGVFSPASSLSPFCSFPLLLSPSLCFSPPPPLSLALSSSLSPYLSSYLPLSRYISLPSSIPPSLTLFSLHSIFNFYSSPWCWLRCSLQWKIESTWISIFSSLHTFFLLATLCMVICNSFSLPFKNIISYDYYCLPRYSHGAFTVLKPLLFCTPRNFILHSIQLPLLFFLVLLSFNLCSWCVLLGCL